MFYTRYILMNANEQPVVYFPLMHAELAPREISPKVLFLDPGCVAPEDQKEARHFRPANLPFTDAHARAFLRDSLEFGNQFKRPADMAWLQAGPMENFFSGSMQEIKSELLSPGDKQAREESKVIADAQLVLLLGFHLEERMMELDGLESRINGSVADFGQSLGLDEEDQFPFDPALTGQNIRPDFTPDWRRLLSPFMRFLPDHACFVLTDPDILSDLVAEGMHLALCSAKDVAPFFPGWEPDEGIVFSKNTVTGKELAAFAGVECPGELEEKEWEVVGVMG